MIYKPILQLEQHERNLIVDIALIINNAIEEKQTIPNEKMVRTTKELIKSHNVDFAQFIYFFETDKEIWQNNGFDSIFSTKTIEALEKVLFATRNNLLKNRKEDLKYEKI